MLKLVLWLDELVIYLLDVYILTYDIIYLPKFISLSFMNVYTDRDHVKYPTNIVNLFESYN